jgi:hypothetical protein
MRTSTSKLRIRIKKRKLNVLLSCSLISYSGTDFKYTGTHGQRYMQ